MSDTPSESNFMQAAEKAIADLQHQVDSANDRVDKATSIMDDALEAARWRKIQVQVLGILTVLIIIGAVVLGFVTYQTHNEQVALRNAAVSQCQNSNTVRSQNTRIWDNFLTLIVSSPADKEEAQEISNFAKNNVPSSSDKATWEAYLKILEQNSNSGPEAKQEVEAFERFIAGVNAPRDCVQIYNKAALGQ